MVLRRPANHDHENVLQPKALTVRMMMISHLLPRQLRNPIPLPHAANHTLPLPSLPMARQRVTAMLP